MIKPLKFSNAKKWKSTSTHTAQNIQTQRSTVITSNKFFFIGKVVFPIWNIIKTKQDILDDLYQKLLNWTDPRPVGKKLQRVKEELQSPGTTLKKQPSRRRRTQKTWRQEKKSFFFSTKMNPLQFFLLITDKGFFHSEAIAIRRKQFVKTVLFISRL